MQALSFDRIQEVAGLRDISYEPLEHDDPLVVRTRMARNFPVPQETVFDSFADPVSHARLFAIIRNSTGPIREGLEEVLPDNQFLAFEHVQEGQLSPRIMLLRYTLERPYRITKEAVTDPFLSDDIDILSDRKRAKVVLEFERVSDNETRIITESEFQTATGAVFSREFIDTVWLNFFERMLVVNGQILDTDMLTA